MKYSNKVVWITGASSGIGEHLAYAFAEEGASLVLSSRNEKELQRVKNNCPENTEVLVLPLDIEKRPQLPEAVNKVINHFGYINILINNAGVSQRELAQNTQVDVDQRIMNINFLGAVALTKAVLPHFLQQQFGHFVVISSVLGKMSVPYRSAYSASKHALHGFFDSLRAELIQDNIKVTIICPGYVHTNVTINALKGDGSKNNQMAPSTRRGLEPDLFAQKALQAIAQEKKEVVIAGVKESLALYLKRFLPPLYFRAIAQMKLN